VLPVLQDAALELKEADPTEFPLTAKLDISFFTFLLVHSGHWTLSVLNPITKVSKGFPQS